MTQLPELAGTGATYVLYLLFVLSIAQLTIIIERAVLFIRTQTDRSVLESLLAAAVRGGRFEVVSLELAEQQALEARVLASGAARASDGPEAANEIMRSRLMLEKKRLESNLSFLGTLGNNAPFIGLFGTVLGIIHAFADLGASGAGQASQAVMTGISEALIATAVGLMVALPAVVAYNVFTRTIKNRVTDAESLAGALLAHLRRDRAPIEIEVAAI